MVGVQFMNALLHIVLDNNSFALQDTFEEEIGDVEEDG